MNSTATILTKMTKTFTATLLIAVYLLSPLSLVAGVDNEKKADKAKPYPLDTCIVSDEKLGGDHGDAYTFVHNGQEFKLCCKPCLKDFDKDPKSYHKKLAKLAKEQKKAQKKEEKKNKGK